MEAINEGLKETESENTATLANLDRPKCGIITVDLDLLRAQIAWLHSLYLERDSAADDARSGITNLLEGIQDLTDPPEDEEEDCE